MNKFISFEGTDGVGKTTQINLFLDRLKSKNINYVLFREPGGTEVAEQIRKILLDTNNDINNLSETLLFLSARADLVETEIKPSLNKVPYASSSAIAQLDCDIDTSISRLGTKDRMEKEGRDFLLKVKNGFLELAKSNLNRYVIVDANRSIEYISKDIWKNFKERYYEK